MSPEMTCIWLLKVGLKSERSGFKTSPRRMNEVENKCNKDLKNTGSKLGCLGGDVGVT